MWVDIVVIGLLGLVWYLTYKCYLKVSDERDELKTKLYYHQHNIKEGGNNAGDHG